METKPLREIADIQTGPFGSQLHKEDYVDEGTPIVTVEHLGNRIFTEQNLPCVSDIDKNRLSKYVLHEGDIVFSRVGSVDRCSYVDAQHDGWMFSGRCLRVRPHAPIDSMYLYYCFCMENTKEFVRNIAVGATMPSINTKLLGEVDIAFPEYDTQKKIAAILSGLDDKIELNQRINDNLQQQISALFQAWFVDYLPFGGVMPSDWKYVDFSTFLSPRNEKSNDVNLPMFSVTDTGIHPREEKFKKNLSMTNAKSKVVYKTDLVFGMSREILNWGVMFAPVGGVSSAYNVYMVDGMVNPFFLESYIKAHYQYFKDLIKPASREGQGIDKAALMSKKLLLPSASILQQYYSIENALRNMVIHNQNEIMRLGNLRDSLLPKLMSGEIDVSDIRL